MLWAIGNEVATLVLLALAFAALYRFVPDEVPPWRGALTALLFEGGKQALGAYFASTTADDAYGGADGRCRPRPRRPSRHPNIGAVE